MFMKEVVMFHVKNDKNSRERNQTEGFNEK